MFEETIVVPLLTEAEPVEKLLSDCLEGVLDPKSMAIEIISKLGNVGCKTALRIGERAVVAAGRNLVDEQLEALQTVLEDTTRDKAMTAVQCDL